MRHNIKLSSIVLAVVVCFCFLPAELFASKKKGSVRSAGSERTAVVQPAASAVPADVGEIDRRSEAANAEITRLTAALAQISQDSLRAAAEIAGKLQSAAPSQAAEAQVAQKMQEIAALRLSRDKARQDSADAVRKIAERFQGFKREASRLDAAVMSASNQLNALSSRRQQVPMEGSGEGARTAQTSRRDHQRVDSLITSKQADLAAWGKRRDQARQDSLALEARISENRIKILNEGRRVDSLVQIATAAMNEMATRQAKARTETSNSPEQAKLTELSKQKFQIEAQLVLTRAEITTSTVDRERLRVAFGDADKKIVQDHLPLAAALASAESIFSDKIAERAALDAVMEMIQLDSAIRKAKDDLNSAIEKKAMNKKGADKLVDQYESDVSTFMGKLDDVRRKNPKATSYDPKISGLVSTADKRKRAETFIGSVNSEIATLTARRDQARRNMENFDRTHPSPARAWAPRLSQLDSTVAVKERAAAQLGLRRDSLENLLVSLKRMVEGFSAAAQAEIRKADSAAAFTKKQWSDLTMQRAQVRGDSLKNESTLSVGLMRLRSEQAKVSAQVSMVDRDIASMNASKERLKKAIIDAQDREEQSKSANQAERKRLDSLVAAKEQEVTQLSVQNEKISQELQAASRELDQELQKQGAAVASISVRITAAEQELAGHKHQVEAARKDRAALEKACLDTLKVFGRNITDVRVAITAKKNEAAMLKNQRMTVLQSLRAEIVRLDSMISAEGRTLAGFENERDRIRRDSIATESSKADASMRSWAGLRRQDSLIADLQTQLTGCLNAVEKARQDSAVLSAPVAIAAAQAMKNIDSLIVIKEREIAELRLQRDKARQDAQGEKQKQSASLSAAHQNISGQRAIAQRKQAEIASLQTQRARLSQDSASALDRIRIKVQSSGADIMRQSAVIAGKKEGLSALQAQRSEKALRLKALGDAAPPPPIVVPLASSGIAAGAGGSAAGNTEAAQKLVEEIYVLIGSDKIDEAVGRFNSGQSFLLANVNAEAFQILKYAVDQAIEAKKKPVEKK